MRQFTFDKKIKLIIEDNALNKIYNYNPIDYNYENGGILLGRLKENSNTYIVTDVSTTNSKDKKGKNYFIRNKKVAQIILNKYWKESEGKTNYLGEWHTHNEKYPNPSFIDKKLIRQMKNNKNDEYVYVFMIILGLNKELYVCTINEQNKIQKLEEE